MTVQPNGTHAKEIALHFLQKAKQETNPNNVARTIAIAKGMLSRGFTYDEIIQVIDHLLVTRNSQIFSLLYISKAIDEVLGELRAADLAVIINEQSARAISSQRHEVKADDSTERNRAKAARAAIQSRLREKFDFDMFEE